ncbi:hypothetical protein E4U43_001985 [Claviceps pusilla]|uniref:Uncharacterized protein n=1 Tax=Claviceps pusilla TaxID=123648 RepID=A0A9P7N9H5_9HYPO|nr:hypothetical protein E4U43_001985 [Claviceps pusilla]
MCTTHIHTYVYPDGHKETVSRPSLCSSSLHNQPCVHNTFFHHASISVPYGHPAAPSPQPAFDGPSSYSASYRSHFLPPSPSYSPRLSASSYRSGDESDRSFRSSQGDRRARSGLHVHDGRRDRDHGRDDSRGYGRDHERTHPERIVLVDNPPTSRTPPRAFAFPSTAPSSPSFASASPRRPMIVDERSRHDRHEQERERERERPRIHIEIVGGHGQNKHIRQSSNSSFDSRRSYYHGASEEEEVLRRRRQRRHHELELEQEEQEKQKQEKQKQEKQKQQAQQKHKQPQPKHQDALKKAREDAQEKQDRQANLRAKIAKANAEIASRQPVPVAPAPAPAPALGRSSTTTAAPQTARDREEELLDAVRKLDIKEKAREERGRLARREEEEAQRRRLMQRMVPGRRATVGPGSRRYRVEYDDGVFRWE